MSTLRLTSFLHLPLAICALVLLNGCSSSEQTNTHPRTPSTTEMGFVFSDFTARQFSKKGMLNSVLSGKQLTHYPNQKRYIIQMPTGLTTHQGSTQNYNAPLWRIEADRAQANEALNQIDWQDNVRMTNTQKPSTIIRTETITQRPNENSISGNKAVTFESILGTIQGQGFSLNTKTQALNLTGDVRGHYHNAQ